MSLFMDSNRIAIALCWLVLFSKVGIYVQAALGDVGMWLYVTACFSYVYGWHHVIPRHLQRLRLWPERLCRPGIG